MYNEPFQLDLSFEERQRYLEICDIRKMDCSKEELYTKRLNVRRKNKKELEQSNPDSVDSAARAAESYKRWYNKNKEAKAAYNAQWYKDNKERMKQKFKDRYYVNKLSIVKKEQ
jgi:hypothetical protein